MCTKIWRIFLSFSSLCQTKITCCPFLLLTTLSPVFLSVSKKTSHPSRSTRLKKPRLILLVDFQWMVHIIQSDPFTIVSQPGSREHKCSHHSSSAPWNNQYLGWKLCYFSKFGYLLQFHWYNFVHLCFSLSIKPIIVMTV